MKKLKVLLIRPDSHPDELIPPIGLGYLVTALRKKNRVDVLDGIKEGLTPEKFADILKNKKYDIIGISIFTFNVVRVREYIRQIKDLSPDTKIVLGGPHPSCAFASIFQFFPEIDWAFRGEAEVGFARLADLFLRNNNISKDDLVTVPGLIWRIDGRPVVNEQIFVDDLDELGTPSWDILKPQTYPLAPHGGFFKNFPIAPIIITRGCPFSCTYCAGYLVSGKKIRFRSVDNVIGEISMLYHQYGIREIHIEDDNFTFNRQFVVDFCRKLKENNLNVSWTCPNGVRLDTLDEELLLIMKDAGLYSISVGVESGSARILKDMKKSLTKEVIKEKITLIKKCGLEVTGFFIIGYPTETIDDIMETINFSLELGLKRAGFSLFKPFPGTEITRRLIESGELKEMSDEDWARFVLADAVYAPKGFTREQMKGLRKKALKRFYFRPKIMFKFISEIRNLGHLKVVIKRIYSWLFQAK
ncbi:MAG: radical SAM domain-containing protein [Parcubacteria group bacterium Athens0714_26]|nr:MAG: radical SAM domain-containing protein [Parcubacteria group bacterium Athens1014_26]TSD02627.1 MAG: radical SAM domain-containing protein [Parcubacteria group bacterium Athens0714_26]